MNDLGTGLQITVVGMSLVFGALALLWAVIVVLGRLSRPRPAPTAPPTTEADETPVTAGAGPGPEEAAALAVALAILQTEREAEALLPWRLPPVLTRWVAVGFSRQLHAWQPRRTKRDA